MIDVKDIIGFIKNKNDLLEKIFVHFFKFNITYVYSLFYYTKNELFCLIGFNNLSYL